MLKEQHIDDPFTIMVCMVKNIVYCLAIVYRPEDNYNYFLNFFTHIDFITGYTYAYGF